MASIDKKLLEAVERLVSDDLCEDLAFNLAKRRVTSSDGMKAIHRLSQIYKLVHSRMPHTCFEAHGDWRKSTKNLLTQPYDYHQTLKPYP